MKNNTILVQKSEDGAYRIKNKRDLKVGVYLDWVTFFNANDSEMIKIDKSDNKRDIIENLDNKEYKDVNLTNIQISNLTKKYTYVIDMNGDVFFSEIFCGHLDIIYFYKIQEKNKITTVPVELNFENLCFTGSSEKRLINDKFENTPKGSYFKIYENNNSQYIVSLYDGLSEKVLCDDSKKLIIYTIDDIIKIFDEIPF